MRIPAVNRDLRVSSAPHFLPGDVISAWEKSSISDEMPGEIVEANLAPLPAASRTRVSGIAPEEFDAIVRQNQRRIYRILLLHVRDADAADSLTQDCFLRAFKHREKFRGDCSLETWLIRIAINLARDHTKNRRRLFWARLFRSDAEPAMAPADPRLSPEKLLLVREEVAALWSAVGDLAHRQRSVFVLHFGEEMTLEEIAAVLEMELGTVKSHLSRALEAVRRRLQR